MNTLKITDLVSELENLKRSYANELSGLQREAEAAQTKIGVRCTGRVSSHDAFNMSATCQTLAHLAGKIEQTENVIRWMTE